MLAVALGASRPGDYRVVVNVDGLAGSEPDSVPSGHYPHVEVPDVTAERFSGWVGS